MVTDHVGGLLSLYITLPYPLANNRFSRSLKSAVHPLHKDLTCPVDVQMYGLMLVLLSYSPSFVNRLKLKIIIE